MPKQWISCRLFLKPDHHLNNTLLLSLFCDNRNDNESEIIIIIHNNKNTVDDDCYLCDIGATVNILIFVNKR